MKKTMKMLKKKRNQKLDLLLKKPRMTIPSLFHASTTPSGIQPTPQVAGASSSGNIQQQGVQGFPQSFPQWFQQMYQHQQPFYMNNPFMYSPAVYPQFMMPQATSSSTPVNRSIPFQLGDHSQATVYSSNRDQQLKEIMHEYKIEDKPTVSDIEFRTHCEACVMNFYRNGKFMENIPKLYNKYLGLLQNPGFTGTNIPSFKLDEDCIQTPVIQILNDYAIISGRCFTIAAISPLLTELQRIELRALGNLLNCTSPSILTQSIIHSQSLSTSNITLRNLLTEGNSTGEAKLHEEQKNNLAFQVMTKSLSEERKYKNKNKTLSSNKGENHYKGDSSKKEYGRKGNFNSKSNPSGPSSSNK